MKKILLVTPFFYPEKISTGLFNTKIVKALEEKGCVVDVWCSHPFYPSWVPESSDLADVGNDVKRMGGWIRYPKSLILRRFLLEIWFFIAITFRAIKNRFEYDIVISHVPPSLFTFPLFLFKRKSRVVVLVADLQSIHVGDGSNIIKKCIFNIVAWIERLSFDTADHVVFMSDAMLDRVGRSNLSSRIDVDVCYPGVTISNDGPTELDLLHFISSDESNVVYSGALGEKQNPEFLYELFGRAASLDPTLKFFILSEGDLFKKIRAAGEAEGSSVNFLPLVKESEVTELYAKSTVQIVPQKPGTSDGSLPSKVPNLMSNHVPIFAITDMGGDLANLLDEYPLGYHTQSAVLDEVAVELVEFIQVIKMRARLSEGEAEGIERQLRRRFSFDALIDILSGA